MHYRNAQPKPNKKSLDLLLDSMNFYQNVGETVVPINKNQ